MEQAALRIMEAIGVQVLVIDEVHNILAGSYREQRIVLNTLRFLSNRLQISLVCFGVNEAREAISGDVVIAQAGLGGAVRATRTGLEAPRFLDWSGLLAVERADYEGAGAASGFA
jgi:hypothetical protein